MMIPAIGLGCVYHDSRVLDDPLADVTRCTGVAIEPQHVIAARALGRHRLAIAAVPAAPGKSDLLFKLAFWAGVHVWVATGHSEEGAQRRSRRQGRTRPSEEWSCRFLLIVFDPAALTDG
jgi:hypothetical protein